MPTALVIDDNQMNADLLAAYLRTQGFVTISCYNGVEGFELAQTIQPDLILLDLVMPEHTWDGQMTLDHLKAEATTTHIPVVAVTALDAVPNVFERGFADVLHRPFSLDALNEIIRWHVATVG